MALRFGVSSPCYRGALPQGEVVSRAGRGGDPSASRLWAGGRLSWVRSEAEAIVGYAD